MDVGLIVRGVVIGFTIAAPVGPIGVLCIRRTLANGRLAGLASGLGAATADLFYGAVAAFGITAVTSILTSYQFIFQVVGGLFLCYLGVRIYLAQPSTEAAAAKGRGVAAMYGSTLFLTLTNPATILLYTAILASLGANVTGGSYANALLLIAGVFLGSAGWWLILVTGVSLFRARLTPQGMRWVNRLSGVVILAIGLLALFRR